MNLPHAPALQLALQVTETGSTTQVALVLASFVVSAVLGLFIARKAYQGYRRNDSTPMLLLAVGIVLLTAVPAVFSFGLSTFTTLPGSAVVLVTNLSEIAGLVAIAYSLYGRF
ncbi:hypothetical protein GJR96_09015 [Haloferax sp. MBLA0076]|uniref:Uncharacterized protein n=1 Tax=Haloferax litoreum TaxID=2666140 RepID=A0A6A8GG13_9EURY|nr:MULTISPECIES: hypothetical protein [Haloferax]KAB1193579.1 hypothetical protein Hfx1148_09000 [Haloferax sp. CBA1148]MRX22095.1 hypothetical protein [Haloferax litoreum]